MEMETLKMGEKYLSSAPPPHQQIPKWFPDFDYFSFSDCNNMITCKTIKCTKHLVWLQGFGAVVHVVAAFTALLYATAKSTLVAYLVWLYSCVAEGSYKLCISSYLEQGQNWLFTVRRAK